MPSDSPYRLHNPAGVAAPAWVPLGWTWLDGCHFQPPTAPASHVLLHPSHGVAVLEEAPAQPGAAVAQLRARLAARRFEAIFPGHLPVVQAEAPADALPDAAANLPMLFAEAPPLELAGGDAWLGMASRILLRSAPTPDLSPAPVAMPQTALRQPVASVVTPTPFPPIPRPPDARRTPWVAWGGGVLALAGLVAGAAALWTPAPRPAALPTRPLPAQSVPTPPRSAAPLSPSVAVPLASPPAPAAVSPLPAVPPAAAFPQGPSPAPAPAPAAPAALPLPLPPPPPPRAAAAEAEGQRPAPPPRRRPARRPNRTAPQRAAP